MSDTTHPPRPAAGPPGAPAFLQGGGELGALIRAKDWSQTPLGPPERWPQSLKTTLGILLNSRYPMFVFWGPELIKIYNDGYRPITGHKHPWALGRPAREVWPEIWSDIEPLVARALAGDPTYSDDLGLVLERSGFREYYHPRTGSGHGEHCFGFSTLVVDLFSPSTAGVAQPT